MQRQRQHRATATRLYHDRTGADLDRTVLTLRARGWSWRRIANDVVATTGGLVRVSHEALRQWFGDDDTEQRLRGLDAAIDAAADRGDHVEVARLRDAERAVIAEADALLAADREVSA